MKKLSISTGEKETTENVSYSCIIDNTSKPRSSRVDQALNYNIDAHSTHALQVALKNMKERYQKLQKKISLLEEENTHLIDGKSELFGEIGKMQESSIKLREKNLQLNHEVHSKHQECCSLKDKCSVLSRESLRQSTQLAKSSLENKRLLNQVCELEKENSDLKYGVQRVLAHCKSLSAALPSDLLSQLVQLVNESPSNKIKIGIDTRTKIVPLEDDIHSFDDFEQISISGEEMSAISGNENSDEEENDSFGLHSLECLKESMSLAVSQLQEQKDQLLSLTSIIQSNITDNNRSNSNESGRDLGSNYTSRLATCNSVINPCILSSSGEGAAISVDLEDMKGEANVLVESTIKIADGSNSPFDWKKIQVSDDESHENGRPSTRTVSTSPDRTIEDSNALHPPNRAVKQEVLERTCPMCNAIFPHVIPQETFESHVVSHFEGDIEVNT